VLNPKFSPNERSLSEEQTLQRLSQFSSCMIRSCCSISNHILCAGKSISHARPAVLVMAGPERMVLPGGQGKNHPEFDSGRSARPRSCPLRLKRDSHDYRVWPGSTNLLHVRLTFRAMLPFLPLVVVLVSSSLASQQAIKDRAVWRLVYTVMRRFEA
jgi:hypothetical protein